MQGGTKEINTIWQQHAGAVRDRFAELTSDGALREKALRLLEEWLDGPVFASQRPAVVAHLEAGRWDLLLDAFYQYVPFGTGGRRGRVGYGPNRINDVTVALSVQGHCNYLNETANGCPVKVVVAYDTRIFRDLAGTYTFLGESHPMLGLRSADLARQAAAIYAANGITAYIPSFEPQSQRFLPTPELSFAIRHLDAAGGVNMSASHNHPDDNGFKFFNRQGAQDVPPFDEELASYMDGIREVRRVPFDEGVAQGRIVEIPHDVRADYLALNSTLGGKAPTGASPVIFTPLCGTGDASVGEVLRQAGYPVALYAPQANFDGTFASVASRLPNPEIPQAAEASLSTPGGEHAILALSTDPDADRLGAYARTASETWRFLTGNEIAVLIANYLALDDRGPKRKGLLIKTLVTTRALEEIARRAGCQIVPDLLVGFKYIANVLDSLEKSGRFQVSKTQTVSGRAEDLILAAEESHGFLLTDRIRDKDAAGAAIVLCELTARLEREGLRLPEYLDQVSIDLGNYVNVARSIVMRGIKGMESMARLMKSLRTEPFASFGEYRVEGWEDFQDEELYGPILGETDAAARNLLLCRLGVAQVVIRPSGTEPKLKVYVDAEGRALGAPDDRAEALARARQVAETVFAALIARVGVRLSESASLLPDYVDLDLKQAFDEVFRPALEQAADQLAAQPAAARLAWLRKELAAYAPGADPLIATGGAVKHLCGLLADRAAGDTRLLWEELAGALGG